MWGHVLFKIDLLREPRRSIDLSGLARGEEHRLAGDAWDVNPVSKILLQMLGRDGNTGALVNLQQRITAY